MQRKEKLIVSAAGVLVFIFAAGLVISYLLPGIAGPRLERMIARESGLSGFRMDIRFLGFRGADFGRITTGRSMTMDALHLDYTPASLMDRHVSRISISGLSIRAVMSDAGIRLLDFPQLPAAGSSGSGSTGNAGEYIRYLPDIIEFRNSWISLDVAEGAPLVIPFDLACLVRPSGLSADIQVSGSILGNPLAATLSLGPGAGLEELVVRMTGFATESLASIADRFLPGVEFQGAADIQASKSRSGEWKALVSGIEIRSPDRAGLHEVRLTVTPDSNGFKCAGTVLLEYHDLPRLGLEMEGAWDFQQQWTVRGTFVNPDSSPLHLIALETGIDLNGLKAGISAQGKGSTGSFRFNASLNTVRSRGDTMESDLSNVLLKGDGTVDFSNLGKGIMVDLTAATGPVNVRAAGGDLTFGSVGLKGRGTLSPDLKPEIRLTAELASGSAAMETYGLLASGIHVTIPVSYPMTDSQQQEPGRLVVTTLAHKGNALAELSADLSQTADGIACQGQVRLAGLSSALSDPPLVRFKASAAYDTSRGVSASAEFQADPFRLSAGDIPRYYLPAVKGMTASCLASGTGSLSYETGHVATHAAFQVAQGTLMLESPAVSLDGLATTLVIDDALAGRSSPGQVLTIDAVSMNDIRLSDFRLAYTLESPSSLLIEKAGFNWCRGRVTTESMRLSSGKKEMGITLYCDRLHLADLLRQVGSFQAEGDGSLNGRLPVRYADNTLSFENGFLFSTPGVGGVITVSGTDILTAGIPRNTMQFTQVDLAREALKNYRYDWARLYFNSTGDTLLVNMKFDGRPENLLPFVYKKELGGFVRVDASSPGSRFQGINIDVNLTLPFTRIIQYGNSLDSLFK